MSDAIVVLVLVLSVVAVIYLTIAGRTTTTNFDEDDSPIVVRSLDERECEFKYKVNVWENEDR